MRPLLIERYTLPNGKHYRIAVRVEGCLDVDCPDRPGLHVHLVASTVDPLPITHRGMVTWPTRRRRRRRRP